MSNDRQKHIKHAQKESLYLKEISRLFLHITADDPALRELHVSRVKLSPDKSLCTVYFYTPAGQEGFREKMEQLILYKPSLRHALAQKISSRYTPDLRFSFDKQFEKQKHLESLLESISKKSQ